MTLIRHDDLLLESRTIEDLTEIARQEHEQVIAHGNAFLRHAMAAGDALSIVRSRISGVENWDTWVFERVGCSPRSAARYMRLAVYRSDVEAWLSDGGDGSLMGAYNHLRGMKAIGSTGIAGTRLDRLRVEMDRLHGAGLSEDDIAAALELSQRTVHQWLDPALRQKAKARVREAGRRRRAKEARDRKAQSLLKRQQLDAAVKRVGGTPADAYRYLRLCADAIRRSLDEASDVEVRDALRKADQAVVRVESCVLDALKIDRRRPC